MSQEIELAATDAAGDLLRWRRKMPHADEVGGPCANCATLLQGPWCHQCGQLGEDFHRSTWRLLGEALEGVLHLDGRLWRTLPDLFLRPGRLTRDYLEGHRAPQIPPLRLFLVVLLVVFTSGSIGGGLHAVTTVTGDKGKVVLGQTNSFLSMTPEERAKAKAALEQVHVRASVAGQSLTETWLRDRASRVIDDPERFTLVLESWSERFAFLMLPISAALLSLLFVFQRRFFVFDHIIFSLHSLSAMGLLLSVTFLLNAVTNDSAGFLLLAAPVHLFLHMRGVYGTSVFGALVRMALLFVFSSVGFALLMFGLILVGLNGMG